MFFAVNDGLDRLLARTVAGNVYFCWHLHSNVGIRTYFNRKKQPQNACDCGITLRFLEIA